MNEFRSKQQSQALKANHGKYPRTYATQQYTRYQPSQLPARSPHLEEDRQDSQQLMPEGSQFSSCVLAASGKQIRGARQGFRIPFPLPP